MRGFCGVMALMLVTACHQVPAEVKVTDAWVRLPAVQGNPGAAYFKLSAGDRPLTLLEVSAPGIAIRAELHESMKGGAGQMAMTSMKPVKEVNVAARGSVSFAPGGKHVMLFDVSPRVRSGEQVPLTLSFADGKKILTQAMVVGAGDPAYK